MFISTNRKAIALEAIVWYVLRRHGVHRKQEDRNRPGINRAVAVFVEADHDIRKGRRGPCRNVTIVDNQTIGGILFGGDPSQDNVIRGNRNLHGTALIKKQVDKVRLEGNRGYEVVSEW